MASHRLLQLALCLAAPVGVLTLHVKQEPRTLVESHSKNSMRLETDWCSSEQNAPGEMYLARALEQSCMPPSKAGVGHVAFVKRNQNKPVQNARKTEHTNLRRPVQKKTVVSRHTQALNKKEIVEADEAEVNEEEAQDPKMADWGDGHHGELGSYGSVGDACWEKCQAAGFCEWCGDGNACCLKDGKRDPEECNGVEFLTGTAGVAECVEPLVDRTNDVNYDPKQLVVWVSGYPRSGSSTLLSMVSATVDDNRAGGHTFSLFEPCHDDDTYEGWLSDKGCRQLLFDVAHCDFSGIQQLWGWRDPHSTSNFTKDFSLDIATEMCTEADIVAFKTVDWGHDLQKWDWLLNSRVHMKVLDMVRDPRAIYASWKRLEPFKTLVETHDFYTLREICDHFARNIDFKDHRVKRIIFEDLMKNPHGVTQDVYKFLGQPWTSVQDAWIRGAFNVDECPPPAPGMEGFTDCHESSGVDPRGDEKWRAELTAEELAVFDNSESCQRVAHAYRYPPH